MAAALPGPAGPGIVELLLQSAADPDARAFDQDKVYEPDKVTLISLSQLFNKANGNRKVLSLDFYEGR